MKTIFLITCKKYIDECRVTAITSLSIVARYENSRAFEVLKPISEENKSWFKTRKDAENYISKQNEIAEKIAELEKEYSK